MKLKNCITDKELRAGILNVTGRVSPRTKLNQALQNEIIDAVTNGTLDIINQHYHVSELNLIQVAFPAKLREFKSFFTKLLSIETLHTLRIDYKSTFSSVLTPEQVACLAELIPTSHISTLEINVHDASSTAASLEKMIETSPNLRNFSTNLTDDSYSYRVLNAGLSAASQLRKIIMPYTARPLFIETIKSAKENQVSIVEFEGGKIWKKPTPVQDSSASVSEEKISESPSIERSSLLSSSASFYQHNKRILDEVLQITESIESNKRLRLNK